MYIRYWLVLLFLTTTLMLEAQNSSGISMEPLSMKECLQRAIRYNLDLEAEAYNPKIREFDIIFAQSQFDPALTSSFLINESQSEILGSKFDANGNTILYPSTIKIRTVSWESGISKRHILGGTVSLTYGIDYSKQFDSPRTIRNPEWGHTLTLKVTQPLLRNLGVAVNTASIRMAENEKERACYALENQITSTLADVQSGYWNLVNYIDNYELQRKSLEQAENLYKITLARIKAGSLAAADILDAERNVATKQDSLIIAERNIYEAEDQLKKLIRPLDIDYYKNIRILPTERVIFKQVNPDLLDFEKNLKDAMDMRADYKASKISLENIGITIDTKKNQLLPSLDLAANIALDGSGRSSSEAFDGMKDTDQLSWGIQLSLEIPLGNRAAKSQYEQALLQKKQLIAQHKNVEDLIILQVRSATRQLATAIHRVTTAHRTRELAEKQLANEENKFRAGIITLFQVQDTEQKLTEARINESNALLDYQQAFVALDKAKGSIIKNLATFEIELPLPTVCKEKNY